MLSGVKDLRGDVLTRKRKGGNDCGVAREGSHERAFARKCKLQQPQEAPETSWETPKARGDRGCAGMLRGIRESTRVWHKRWRLICFPQAPQEDAFLEEEIVEFSTHQGRGGQIVSRHRGHSRSVSIVVKLFAQHKAANARPECRRRA